MLLSIGLPSASLLHNFLCCVAPIVVTIVATFHNFRLLVRKRLPKNCCRCLSALRHGLYTLLIQKEQIEVQVRFSPMSSMFAFIHLPSNGATAEFLIEVL